PPPTNPTAGPSSNPFCFCSDDSATLVWQGECQGQRHARRRGAETREYERRYQRSEADQSPHGENGQLVRHALVMRDFTLLIRRRVSMIVTGRPQFDTQDDDGLGSGILPIAEWQLDPSMFEDGLPDFSDAEIDLPVRNAFVRLRHVFRRTQRVPL